MTTLKSLILFFVVVAGILYYIKLAESSTIKYVREEDPYHLVEAEITAYTSSPDETDDTPTLMADGTNTRQGAIACPSKYSFGTKVIIGDDTYFCADRMNKRYRDSEHFDIWVQDKNSAFEWGRRTLTIKIIH